MTPDERLRAVKYNMRVCRVLDNLDHRIAMSEGDPDSQEAWMKLWGETAARLPWNPPTKKPS